MKRTFAFIFARGGSKGLPKKNVKPLLGKPLIGWSIETALKCPSIDKVFVSTDDQEIAAIARSYGAEVPFMRPAELASDTCAEWYAWRHAVEFFQTNHIHFDKFVSLPATSPLRSIDDVERCISALNDDSDIVITVKEAERSPYFNMVTLDQNGYSKLAITPKVPLTRRQDAPQIFDVTTVCYVTRPSFIIDNFGIFSGRVRSIIVPTSRAIDIDNSIDFKLAEVLADAEGSSS